ncbi:MAG: hypothetical protein K2R98_30150 [Gemmataceae bacterium]|nr:hypothetical protein [Gemmataceae bacterium]
MEQLGQTLWQLVEVLGSLVVQVIRLGLHWSLLLAWLAWWLWGVNWSKAWPVLARGAWAPVALLIFLSALVWSRIQPGSCDCLQFVVVPNFWWQLGAVGLLAAITLMCGWLQGVFGWQPAEISLDPPVSTVHTHGHDDHAGPEHRHVEEVPRHHTPHH